ncbi:Subtilase family protein [Dyadobacter sp. SG02]|uniref:S8 family serine peptidase n=1 Tax=Dyadobacter sp. SG02 TaxID=1855291 RepID=UPI0008D8BD11|nr:S8 family serine peptidase [Dyadobacter sp. SG02]SEI40340.1 Subtilase family protein [Dyadobacter sp. SG02]
MQFFYQGENSKPHQLTESPDKIIIRTGEQFNPEVLFSRLEGFQFTDRTILLDYYPEASSYVYRLRDAILGEIDLFKQLVRSLDHPLIEYIGTVLQRADSGVYQIYTGNLFIKFKKGTDDSQYSAVFARYGLVLKRKLHFTENAFFMQPVEDVHREIFTLCNTILREQSVEFCHPELVVHRKTVIKTHAPAPVVYDRWIEKMIHLQESWTISKGKGSKICIVDDGIDLAHPSFLRKKRKIVSTDMLLDGSDGSHKDDSEMHGTACASIACSDDPDTLGIAPEAELIVVRSKGLGSVLESEAIYWAVKQGADIISCSWGPADGDPFSEFKSFSQHPLPDHTRLALEYAATKGRNGKGCLIFFAAGNGKEPVDYDGYASNEFVMAIGAVNRGGTLTNYSDYGNNLFCCFPSSEVFLEAGVVKTAYGVPTIDRIGGKGYSETDYYYAFGGTSASCPGMAGVAALMLSVNNELTLKQARGLICAACYYPASPKPLYFKDKLGHGIINAHELLKLSQLSKNSKPSYRTMSDSKKNKKIAIHVAVDNVSEDVYKGTFPQLEGCKNDLGLFKAVTEQKGYQQLIFTDDDATRGAIRTVLENAVREAEDGDEVLFTYSGHGTMVEDKNLDDEDGNDEALVLHDGLLLDDEIRDYLTKFKKGVRVFWYTDCCHSGTNTRNRIVTRGIGSLVTPQLGGLKRLRFMPMEIANKVYHENRAEYNTERKSARGDRGINNEYNASIIHFAACQDHQFASEINGYGDFTLKLFNLINSEKGLTYRVTFDKLKGLMPANQIPMLNLYGDTDSFLRALLFAQGDNAPMSVSVDRVDESTAGRPKPTDDQDVFSDLPECNRLLLGGNESLVSFQVKATGRGGRDHFSARSEVSAARFGGDTIWDKAYTAYKSMSPDGHARVFIEPDLASVVFGDPRVETSRGSDDDYLDTYPSPAPGSGFDALWHLTDTYSQLTSALKEVCPNEFILGKVTRPLDQYPLIAHIDTGVLAGGPMHPMNLDLKSSHRFDDPIDRDKWIIPDFIEQQGHGNGTIALLAGGKLELPGETALNANDYFGGFPFARVVTLKISESVAILRGKSFARALDYAVDVLKADVVTMSMAGAPSKVMVEAVNNAYDKGVIVVSAGGNSWSRGIQKALPSTLMYPARLNRVIAATGATFDKTPYLNEFNEVSRAAGGKYMQSCYGPNEAMRTALAAYTPNVLWFSNEKRPFYSKSGGGTSSATPQIAAAAALYCLKYQSVLKHVAGTWKKAEIVRQALFQSADQSKNADFGNFFILGDRQYNEYFGNGLLKAKDALDINAQGLLNSINQNPAAFEEERDSIGRVGIDDLIGMWYRSSGTANDPVLKEMFSLEIEQLIFTDPELAEFSKDNQLTAKLKTALYYSKYASSNLKKLLAVDLGLSRRGIAARSNQPTFATEVVELALGKRLVVSLENIAGTISSLNQPVDDIHIGGFQLSMSDDAVRAGGQAQISVVGEGLGEESMFLVTEEYEDGTKNYRWAVPEENEASRGAADTLIHLEADHILNITIPASRGIFRKIGKFIVNVFRTVQDKAASDMQGLLLGEITTTGINWRQFDPNDKIAKDALPKQDNVLFLSHGTFSSVEFSFRHLLANPGFLSVLKKKKFGNYVLGFNMSTIKSGIDENAAEIASSLKLLGIEASKVTVIGTSRGALVARAAFPATTKMILSAGPHFGTPMASGENIGQLLNRFTGLVMTVSGGSSFALGAIAFAAKMGIGLVWKMPGLADMAPGSKFLTNLNKSNPLGNNHYLIGMNYTGKGLKSVLDIASDNLIFGGSPNDMIVPFLGAINENKTPGNTFFCNKHDGVHHLVYFEDQEIVDQVTNWL